jgi:uncharacterized protein
VIVYADASALVKRYVRESDTARVDRWIAEAEQVASSRISFVEVWRAIANAQVTDMPDQHAAFARDWRATTVIELDEDIADRAGKLAAPQGLRALDAIHLASALTVQAPDLYLLSFDKRLWTAATNSGLNVLPESLP